MFSSDTHCDLSKSSEDEKEDHHNQMMMPFSETKEGSNRCLVVKPKNKQLKTQLKQREFTVCSIFQLNSQHIFNSSVLIKGDIVIPFQRDDEFSRLSKFNLYKRISHINYDPEIASLEMAFEQLSYGIGEFDHLINLFSQQPNSEQKFFALQLQHHKVKVEELKRIQEMLSTYKQIEMVRNLIEESYQQFLDKMHFQIKKMVKEGELRIFKYNFYKVDYEKADFLMTHCCCSELLFAIIGLDINQAQSFSMRKGIIEMLNHNNLFGMEHYYIQVKNNSMNLEQEQDVMLKTFDGIDIYAKLKFKVYYHDDPLLSNIFNSNQQHFSIIQSYEISQNQIDFLLSYRRTFKQKFDLRAFDNEQDWDYFAKSQNFIEKFYG